MKKTAKSVKTVKKAAASNKSTARLVQRFLGYDGRSESLVITAPDNKLLLMFDGGGRVGTEARDVTLAESFAWYKKAHAPLWWVDGTPGKAFAEWLGMVGNGLASASTVEAKPDGGERFIVREYNGDKMLIRDGSLEIERLGKRRSVSVFEALQWWLPTVEAVGNGEDVSSDPIGEFAFFRLLSEGIFVAMNAGELAAAKLCAMDNNGGDVSAWAKAWVASGMEADLPDVCQRCKDAAAIHFTKP